MCSFSPHHYCPPGHFCKARLWQQWLILVLQICNYLAANMISLFTCSSCLINDCGSSLMMVSMSAHSLSVANELILVEQNSGLLSIGKYPLKKRIWKNRHCIIPFEWLPDVSLPRNPFLDYAGSPIEERVVNWQHKSSTYTGLKNHPLHIKWWFFELFFFGFSKVWYSTLDCDIHWTYAPDSELLLAHT